MPRAPMKRPEQDFHRMVATYLRATLPPEVFWFHTPNGGARSKAEAGALKGMGVRAGVPDLGFIVNQRAYWIELKAKGRKRSDAQIDCTNALTAVGCPVGLAYSLDDVVAFIRANGIPSRDVAARMAA